MPIQQKLTPPELHFNIVIEILDVNPFVVVQNSLQVFSQFLEIQLTSLTGLS